MALECIKEGLLWPDAGVAYARSSTAPGLGVYKWSPGRLYGESVSWIPNIDEIVKLLKKLN